MRLVFRVGFEKLLICLIFFKKKALPQNDFHGFLIFLVFLLKMCINIERF